MLIIKQEKLQNILLRMAEWRKVCTSTHADLQKTNTNIANRYSASANEYAAKAKSLGSLPKYSWLCCTKKISGNALAALQNGRSSILK
ncbi:hypothetical protein ACVWQG_10365 [Neisseria meningitidis]